MRKTRRIAVVGIDGAGKSTVIRALTERLPDAAIVHCPTYHTNPNAPLGELSRALQAFSEAADALQSFELKAAALYMQMTLFGPVANAMEDAFSPAQLICERHPLVDTLAYGPFYVKMVRRVLDDSMTDPLEAEMERRVAGSYRAMRAWHALEARRLGTPGSFWTLAQEVCAEIERSLPERLAAFGRRYRATLPDAVILLDVDGEEAHRRVAARSAGGAELHETAAYLNALRGSYHASLAALSREHPEVRVSTIPTGSDRAVEACLDDLLGELHSPSPLR